MTNSVTRKISDLTGRLLSVIFNRPDFITPYELKKRSEEGIANRIISYRPETTWALGFEVIDNPDAEDVTEFEKESEKLISDLDLVDSFLRLDKAAQYGSFSCFLLGFNDKKRLSDPVEHNANNKLIWVRVLDETQITIKKVEDNKDSDRFGQAKLYRISNLDQRMNVSGDVHWSRIIHFNPNGITSNVFGTSVLKAIWNYLDDLDKVSGGYAELYFRQAKNLILCLLDDERVYKEEELDRIEAALIDVQRGMKSYLMINHVKEVKSLTQDVKELSGGFEHIMNDLILPTCGVPARRFKGQEESKLGSTQDEANDEEIANRRRLMIAKKVVKSLWTRLFDVGVLTPPKDGEFDVSFHVEKRISLTDKSTILKSLADAIEKIKKTTGEELISGEQLLDLLDLTFSDGPKKAKES